MTTVAAASLIAICQIDFNRGAAWGAHGPFLELRGGELRVGRTVPPVGRGWCRPPLFVDWHFRGAWWVVGVSFTQLATLASVTAIALWILRWNRWVAALQRARADPDRCAACKYDLHGLPVDAICPECGRRRGAVNP